LRYLMDRLDLLGEADKVASSVMLRMFKLVFGSVVLFADQPISNEPILQPHLGTIIKSSLRLSSKVRDPQNYFLLLRGLFRSIGGGKFELLYKEFLPLLPVLLDGLNRLLSQAHRPSLRELFVVSCAGRKANPHIV